MKKAIYKPWPHLSPNSIIDVVAPAGGSDAETLTKLKRIIENWGLIPRISENIFGSDILCANTDNQRFEQLKSALLNNESKAVWCLRGGYGCTRLIPHLLQLPTPSFSKLFIGFSDITALHLFLQNKWHWQTLHGPSAAQVAHERIHSENINELQRLILGQLTKIKFGFSALNTLNLPTTPKQINAVITGGTLTLVQASLNTRWQIETKDKFLFLEEINESPYRIDRMLQHLQHSGILQNVKAILLGDFIPSDTNQKQLLKHVLTRFAMEQNCPVLQTPDVGHGKTNRGLPLGKLAHLDLEQHQLTIKLIESPTC